MADISDIEAALVTLIATAIFPSITYLPGDVQASATGTPIRLYRGWPESAMLNADVLQSRAHVSVFSEPGMTRNVSRWFPDPEQVATVTPTITATVSGVTVTLAGTITAGNVVGVRFGSPVAAYAYIVQAGDTLTAVAAALATKAGGSSVGAVLTLPSPINAASATMTPQPVATVTRQQEQGIRVSIWAPTPQARDGISSAIDSAISGLRNANGFFTRFFSVGTYEAARIVARTTYTNDMPARDRIWRRDLCYTVEYPTTLLEQNPQALFVGGPMWAQGTLSQLGVVEPSIAVEASDDQTTVFIDAGGNIIGAQPIT